MAKKALIGIVVIAVVAVLAFVIYNSVTKISFNANLDPTMSVDFKDDRVTFIQPVSIDNGGMLALDVEVKTSLYNSANALIVENTSATQVQAGSRGTLSLYFQIGKDAASKLTQSLRLGLSVTGGYFGFLKQTINQDASVTLPFSISAVQQLLAKENVFTFSKPANATGNVTVSPNGDKITIKFADNASLILSNNVTVTKTGNSITIQMPLTIATGTGVSWATDRDPIVSVGWTTGLVPTVSIQPGTYNVAASAYRTDTGVLVATGTATVNIVTIPGQVSTTISISADRAKLSGAPGVRIDYTVTGPISASGSLIITFDPQLTSLLS